MRERLEGNFGVVYLKFVVVCVCCFFVFVVLEDCFFVCCGFFFIWCCLWCFLNSVCYYWIEEVFVIFIYFLDGNWNLLSGVVNVVGLRWVYRILKSWRLIFWCIKSSYSKYVKFILVFLGLVCSIRFVFFWKIWSCVVVFGEDCWWFIRVLYVIVGEGIVGVGF